MLKLLHLKGDANTRQKWKNGTGETFEIAVDHEIPFRWRISRASVSESGPFSAYPGYDRNITLLTSESALLIEDQIVEKVLLPFRPCTFSGESASEIRLSKPAKDFNVFTRRDVSISGVYTANITFNEQTQFPISGQEHFLFCAEGKLETLEQHSSQTTMLAAGDTLQITRSNRREYLNLRTQGHAPLTRCVWVVIHL